MVLLEHHQRLVCVLLFMRSSFDAKRSGSGARCSVPEPLRDVMWPQQERLMLESDHSLTSSLEQVR